MQIVWPEEWTEHKQGDAVFVISVDGVHCSIQEPYHPTLSKNPKYYSHKYNAAGLNYELAVSIWENKLVWMNGPFPATSNDQGVYNKGLANKVHRNKLVVCDKGYNLRSETLCKPDPRDSIELREFKARARARHESFNKRIKNFKCMQVKFHHGPHLHKHCFEAICVICQYQLENGCPLFDVTVRD